jgi:nucleotide-binding universal stress UspA family protein
MSLTVLCAITDDDRLDDVVATGRVLAATGGLRPVFVHVGQSGCPMPMPVGYGPGAGAAALAFAGQSPARRAGEVSDELVEAADLWDDPTIVAVGDPATELDRIAHEVDAALVVAGTHGRGLISGTLHSSISRTLARTGTRPVLLVRRGVVPCLGGPVVCGVDLATDHHARTAAHAARLAAHTERPLVLVHVPRMEYGIAAGGPVLAPMPFERSARERREVAEEALHALAARLPLEDVEDVEYVVLEPAPVAARLDRFACSREADFLVVGSRGCGVLRTAVEGSVSHDLLRAAGRPLVVVPPHAGGPGVA